MEGLPIFLRVSGDGGGEESNSEDSTEAFNFFLSAATLFDTNLESKSEVDIGEEISDEDEARDPLGFFGLRKSWRGLGFDGRFTDLRRSRGSGSGEGFQIFLGLRTFEDEGWAFVCVLASFVFLVGGDLSLTFGADGWASVCVLDSFVFPASEDLSLTFLFSGGSSSSPELSSSGNRVGFLIPSQEGRDFTIAFFSTGSSSFTAGGDFSLTFRFS